MKHSIGGILFTLTFLSFIFGGAFDSAAQKPVRDTLKTTIFFAKGKCELDKSRNGDFNRFKQFLDSISDLARKNEAVIEKIIITGCASPEGRTDRNTNLAQLRAENIKDVLRLSLPDGIEYEIIPNAVWDYMLETLENVNVANKKEIAKIVVNTPEWIRDKSGKIVDGRKKRLTEFNKGRAWREMMVVLFPMLRCASVQAVYTHVVEPKNVAIKNQVEYKQINTENNLKEKKAVKPKKVKTKVKKVRKPFQMSFRTNLLYDIAMTPNIGAELYFGRNWSMGVNWMYAWWSKPKAAFFWRVYGGDVNIRKYFGRAAKRKQYTGHHIGLMGGMATYDFQLFGSKGILINDLNGNMPFNFFGGLEYGYAFPIGKRLNLDFTVGAGYFRADYFEYYQSNWDATKRSRMFTPLKAEIALVWLIGKENINVRRRK